MGLLDKTNPAATHASVRRAALLGAVLFAVIYAAFAAGFHWWGDGDSSWSMGDAIAWTAFGAFIIGLMEWQPLDIPNVGDVAPHCEMEFAIKLDPERFGPIEEVSVNDLYQEVLDAMRSQHPDQQVDEEEVWARLRNLVVDRLSVVEDEVTPQARFMYELA